MAVNSEARRLVISSGPSQNLPEPKRKNGSELGPKGSLRCELASLSGVQSLGLGVISVFSWKPTEIPRKISGSEKCGAVAFQLS
ncbi:hypothetical protein QQP08_002959 [Theobroma cacao]|nr:hypothetical protein QQP08_002959 [Theobroma cacao]